MTAEPGKKLCTNWCRLSPLTRQRKSRRGGDSGPDRYADLAACRRTLVALPCVDLPRRRLRGQQRAHGSAPFPDGGGSAGCVELTVADAESLWDLLHAGDQESRVGAPNRAPGNER
ncbi:hypothetical protein GCM10010121_049640 [Streptomyces brasiliensis]|uniref:Uncharacterized protein n=1 Tax=Streptomyces brasiliensis TaxID=1954 RepID=A0A917NWR2_9ACTN|nr:hypothetical protein GCM10010121_049640 [Streptomyces brasiliensis]